MLDEKAKYDYLVDLPEGEDIADATNNAMRLIEEAYPDLQGVLPKNYQEFDDRLLRNLIRTFNSDAIKHASGDVFGRVYEFFLMKFSIMGAGAQEGCEFFTPPSFIGRSLYDSSGTNTVEDSDHDPNLYSKIDVSSCTP